LGARTAIAQEGLRTPASQFNYSNESVAYTYNIKDNGSANVLLRADGVVLPLSGGEYSLVLPSGVQGEVSAWYRENGCPKYSGNMCVWGGGNAWQSAEVKRDGDKIKIVVPKRKIDARDEQTGLSVGLIYQQEQVTKNKWWGREVKVTTAKSDNFVNYLNIGVYLPEGVYGRDKQQGPTGWGAAVSQIREQRATIASADYKMAGPSILESAGSGALYRYRQNIAPGEDYTFSLMASTAEWKLFGREIGAAIIWMALIALVLSLLLYLIIGKKPWWWYGLIMFLLTLLFVMVGGLYVSVKLGGSTSGGSGVYPLMMKSDAGTPETAPEVVEP